MVRRKQLFFDGRRRFVVSAFVVGAALLVWRAVYLQLTETDVLQGHGADRYLRTVELPAHRGTITDRHNEPLAVSTPVSSVGVIPSKLTQVRGRWPALARVLGISGQELSAFVQSRLERRFVLLRRHVPPELAEEVMRLDIDGVELRQEVHRYYPAGEVTAHCVGFTDIDDKGQEGIELAYDEHLRGVSGSKRVIQDLIGHVVENVESVRAPQPGHDLALSIDKRVQYVAYRELKAAVREHHARAGSMVVLDAQTGEVLAAVNQPSYNPNNRKQLRAGYFRNRALTDTFEPGSTIKPFTIATALESGAIGVKTMIDTRPGYLRVGRNTVRDLHDYGLLDVTGIISKSSNVGITKIAILLEPAQLWGMLARLGFGAATGSGFPGEAAGRLQHYDAWRTIDHATVGFGYGLSVTALHLANAYLAFANDGMVLPVSLLRLPERPHGQRVMSRSSAQTVRGLLEAAVRQGTGRLARITGYRVAGKTGTVHKPAPGGGYAEDRYVSLFAGMIPASQPRLVAVIMIDEPARGEHFGGQVAAPVFARVMRDATRLLDIPPDDIASLLPQNDQFLTRVHTADLPPVIRP
ncbi:MAG: penicillin-binding protein 2 [Pseudomonadota bacterium]|nr:penicillin-binding protein 2 [Pseudomonadota bacterium]